MIGIFLLGEHQNNDLVQVLQSAQRAGLTPNGEKQDGFCLCEGEFQRITAPCGILLPGPSFSCRKIELCGTFWCVFDSSQKNAARFAKQYEVKTLTCGFSPYDTVTLSSITPEQAVVTLQREIRTIRGTIAEPADHPILLQRPCSPQSILRSAACLILMGYGDALGDFYL